MSQDSDKEPKDIEHIASAIDLVIMVCRSIHSAHFIVVFAR